MVAATADADHYDMYVVVPGPDDDDVQHPGWEGDLNATAAYGYLHDAPEVACGRCLTRGLGRRMTVVSARVVGGPNSVMWAMSCPECGLLWSFPATAYPEPSYSGEPPA